METLFDAFARQLARHPLPPLVTETVLVPGPGIARWLQLRLAERFGIAGGFRLPFFGAFLRELLQPGDDDPFRREVLVFRLWRLLDADPGAFGPAAAYVQHDADGQKRLQLCQRLAACFDDYQLYRDDLLDAFARGTLPALENPHVAWQAELWRRLLHDAGEALPPPARRPRGNRRKGDVTPSLFGPDDDDEPAPPRAPRAHRLAALRELLADERRARAALPPRLSVFGAATLPPAFLQLLARFAVYVPVDLYVPQPTLHYIGDQRGRPAAGDNGLLVRLGQESREFADRLLDAEQPAPGAAPLLAVEADADAAGDAADAAPTTLLTCVQHDLVHAIDRDGRSAPRYEIAADDASLRVHTCHSPHRELEVVRDQIFAAFAADPTLLPHDVLVLVPDIDRYAPYAHAVFGTTEQDLPFRVVDRSPARERPVCSTLLRLLRLARDRLTVFDVLHVLENAAVRRRFGLFPSDVPTLRHLCQRAGIRWGIDAESRQRHNDVPPFAENSWRQGITRLVLGLATGPTDDVVLGQLPVGGVTAAHQDLLGRFLALLGTLFPALEALAGTRPLAEWADVLDHTVAGMFLASDGDDEAGLQQLAAATAELRRVATTARHTGKVAPAVIGDWLDQQLGQGSGGHGFLGGPVTIAAMLPLRAVPVRCLFLCGLDDASFPHQDHPAPFDLMAAARRPGDRSRRLDDRQLFLDLLLAARERLQLTYVGRSAKDNSPVTPSIVLTELLEHLDRTCVAAGGGSVRERIVVDHPLQPWSPRYADGHDPRLFSFANRASLPAVPQRRPEPVWIAATAAAAPVAAATPLVEPDAVTNAPTVRLDDLLLFWWHPCRHFLRHALGVRLRNYDDHERDDEPFQLDSLDRYQLEEAALRAALAGRAPRDRYQHARAGGLLPVGKLGRLLHAETDREVQAMLAQLPPTTPRRLDVDLVVAGHHLVGELPRVHPDGLWYARPTSELKAKDKLRCWLQHLVLTLATETAAVPQCTWMISRKQAEHYLPVAAADARHLLGDLVLLYRRGLDAPLPFFENSSSVFAEQLFLRSQSEASAMRAARAKWTLVSRDVEWQRGDDEDADIRLCMRGRDPLTEPAFAELARRIWRPALQHLQEHDS